MSLQTQSIRHNSELSVKATYARDSAIHIAWMRSDVEARTGCDRSCDEFTYPKKTHLASFTQFRPTGTMAIPFPVHRFPAR